MCVIEVYILNQDHDFCICPRHLWRLATLEQKVKVLIHKYIVQQPKVFSIVYTCDGSFRQFQKKLTR